MTYNDVAVSNCLCASELPGMPRIGAGAVQRTLDRWGNGIRQYTQACMPSFISNREAYQSSLSYYRVLCLVTFVERGLGVKYGSTAIGSCNFKHAEADFLPGVVELRQATCASFPVLYVALGRRLGYPMYLAIAKGHVFAKWIATDSGEQFNIDALGHGLNTPPNEHYRTWPRPLTPRDIASGDYLRPLKSHEELALFLCTRGHCLTDNGRFDEAYHAYEEANRLWPRPDAHTSFRQLLELKRTMSRTACDRTSRIRRISCPTAPPSAAGCSRILRATSTVSTNSFP